MMIQELQAAASSLSILGNLLKETHTLMKLFSVCKVQHVNRLIGNEVAHRLACYAWNVVDIEMWWDNVPILVSQAV